MKKEERDIIDRRIEIAYIKKMLGLVISTLKKKKRLLGVEQELIEPLEDILKKVDRGVSLAERIKFDAFNESHRGCYLGLPRSKGGEE